jgi:hypothetical protein
MSAKERNAFVELATKIDFINPAVTDEELDDIWKSFHLTQAFGKAPTVRRTEGTREIYHKQVCDWAGCISMKRTCEGSRCSLAWGVRLEGRARSASRVVLAWQLQIGEVLVRPWKYYGHDERGTYSFHGSFGVPYWDEVAQRRVPRGEYPCSLAGAICHLTPTSVIKMNFRGHAFFADGTDRGITGHGTFYGHS